MSGRDASQGGRFILLVVGPGTAATLALPDTADLTIGDDDAADIKLHDALVSPLHALLRVAGAVFSIEDLGGAGGTWVRDEPIPPSAAVGVARGDAILVGSTVLVIRQFRTGIVVDGDVTGGRRPPSKKGASPRDALYAKVLGALLASRWNQTHAARLLGMQRNKFIRLMQRYGISRRRR